MEQSNRQADTSPARSEDDLFAGYELARPVPDGRPWMIANMVVGLDGSLAWHGRVGVMSSESDRTLFVRLRGLADAVLVGAGTVRAEGYGPVRLPEATRAQRIEAGRPEAPPIVVVSRSLELDWDAPLFDASSSSRPMVVTAGSAPAERLARAGEHAEVIVVGDATVDLREAMIALAARGIAVVVTEGGPTLLGELVSLGLLDELCLTLAPLFGGDPLTMANRERADAVMASFSLAGLIRQGDEVYLRYLLRRDGAGVTG